MSIHHPRFLEYGNVCSDLRFALSSIFAELGFGFLNHSLQRQLGIAGQSDVNGEVFVDILNTFGVLDDDLAVRDRLTVMGVGHT